LRSTSRVDLLNVDLDEIGETVLVKVENEIVNEVESVANDNERELIGEFGFLEEVLDLLRVVEVRLANDTFDFADLTSSSCGLDVLEVNF